MTTFVMLLGFTAAAIPIAAVLDRSRDRFRLLGLAMLIAPAIAALILLSLSIAGLKWNLIVVAVIYLALSFAALFTLRRMASRNGTTAEPRDLPRSLSSLVVDLVTITTMIGFALYATTAEPWEWDYWAIWGLKAKLFLLHGGIDFAWMRGEWNSFAHPDYPPLVTLIFDAVMLPSTSWNGRWLGLVYVFFVTGGTLLVRSFLRRNAPLLAASIATLAVVSCLVSTWMGMAEGVLVAFAAGALLYLRSGLELEREHEIACGSVLLGFAALSKNEGIALAVAIAVAALLSKFRKPRLLIHFWPAVAIALPWQLVRRMHGLENDLFAGAAAERALSKLESATTIIHTIVAAPMERPLFWIVVVFAIAMFFARAVRHERFLLVVAVLQLAFYFGSYLLTPHDIDWHVATSWSRLLDQLAIPAVLLAIFSVIPSLAPTPEAANEGKQHAGS